MNTTLAVPAVDQAKKLLSDYQSLKLQQPGIRARNAASALQVAEGQLVAAHVGVGVTRLHDRPQALLEAAEALGDVMALTRNQWCVHERKGIYRNPRFSQMGAHNIGLFVNPDIDLRLFLQHWQFCFAVTETSDKGKRCSLQFFDKEGVAVHKIYLTDQSDYHAFEQLINNFTDTRQDSYIETTTYPEPAASQKDDAVDWAAFRHAWENLQDVHDFHPLLRKFSINRLQAFRHIGADFAYSVHTSAARKVLQLAASRQCEIMVFVGNRGCIQIHTGVVNKLLEHNGWFNILDERFNLHLQEKGIAETWVTKKPTSDGIVTALELFDSMGNSIATFFGKRKPGMPELTLWRTIIDQINHQTGCTDAN